MNMEKDKVKKPRSRRYHVKSRGGCSHCKRLRIKCNEEKPICGYCQAHGKECMYPGIIQMVLYPGSNTDKKKQLQSKSLERTQTNSIMGSVGNRDDNIVEDDSINSIDSKSDTSVEDNSMNYIDNKSDTSVEESGVEPLDVISSYIQVYTSAYNPDAMTQIQSVPNFEMLDQQEERLSIRNDMNLSKMLRISPLHFTILKFFLEYTVPYMSLNSPGEASIWRKDMLVSAMQSKAVAHAVMSLSITHMIRLKKITDPYIIQLSNEHYYRAVRQFNKSLTGSIPHSSSELFLASVLILSLGVTAAEVPLVAYGNLPLPDILGLCEGCVVMAKQFIQRGELPVDLEPLLQRGYISEKSPQYEIPFCDCLESQLISAMRISPFEVGEMDCYTAAINTIRASCQRAVHYRLPSYYVTATLRMNFDFISFARRGRPMALIIAAYLCVLMSHSKSFFAQAVVSWNTELLRLVDFLGPQWFDLLKVPQKMMHDEDYFNSQVDSVDSNDDLFRESLGHVPTVICGVRMTSIRN